MVKNKLTVNIGKVRKKNKMKIGRPIKFMFIGRLASRSVVPRGRVEGQGEDDNVPHPCTLVCAVNTRPSPLLVMHRREA